MKPKQVLIQLFVLFIIISCVSCSRNQGVPHSGISFDTSPDISEIDPSAAAAYSQAFVGGTGWHKGNPSHYEYDGGEMEIDIEIANGGQAIEFGIGLVLNGVYQEFSMDADDGQFFDAGMIHRVIFPSATQRSMKLFFTPSVGKAGDELNLAVLMIQNPSFVSTYFGGQRYAPFPAHSCDAGSAMIVKMNVDAEGDARSAAAEIEYLDVPNAYIEDREEHLAGIADPEEREKDRQSYRDFFLFSELPEPMNTKSYLRVPEGDHASIYLDAFGKKKDYRASIFINHQPIEIAPGCAYFDFSTDGEHLSRVTISVPLDGLTGSDCIYAIISERDTDGILVEDWPEDTYCFIYKTPSKHLFVGNVPDFISPSDDPKSSAEPTEAPLPIAEGTALNIGEKTTMPSFLALTSEGMLVIADKWYDGSYTVKVCDPEENGIICEYPISERTVLVKLAGNELITVENPGFDHSAVIVYNLHGKIIRSFEITGETDMSQADRDMIINGFSSRINYSIADGSLMLSEDGGTLLYSEYSVREGRVTVGDSYLLDTVTGEAARFGGVPPAGAEGTPAAFFGTGYVLQTPGLNDNTASLHSIDGKKIGEWKFDDSPNGFRKAVVSCRGDLLLLCDDEVGSGGQATGRLVLIDTAALTVREIETKTANESAWAMLSSDGSIILTIKNDRGNKKEFRLYDTGTGELISEFAVENVCEPMWESIVCIDTANKKLYVQQILYTANSGSILSVSY